MTGQKANRDNSPPSDPEWEMCLALAQENHLEAVRLTPEKLDHQLLDLFPLEVLHNYRILPLARHGFELTLAMADPLDVVAEDVVRSISGCHVKRVVAMASEVTAALEGRLGKTETEIESILARIPDGDDITYVGVQDETPDAESGEGAKGALTPPIIQLVNSIIGDAIRMGASDIHVEPQKEHLQVRYRLDGALRTMLELPKRVQSACISRIKLMSGLDIAESRKPQDGRTRARIDGREVDLRVSSLPTFRGEKVVLRILDAQAVVISLEKLGFSPLDYEKLQQSLNSSQGMILCTGPTGSGKTSTLYSALIQLNTEEENVVTVEDPVEYQLPGVNQVQVNVKAEMTFAAALRSILRQDPDVVLIGEIRDLETAEIAVQAAQTGHLVLSTLHTNDAVSTLSRLILMGVAPYMLASALLCVMAQRLVRRLCPHCKRLGPASESALRLLALAGVHPDTSSYYVPVGCNQCRFLGYKGRMGLFEMLVVSDRVRELLLTGARESEIERVARVEGMHSLLEDGLAKCADGQTSLDEVLRTVTVRREGGRPCPGCGAAVEEDFQYCIHCGFQIIHACPQCSRSILPNWRFCPDCNTTLSPAEPVPAKSRALLVPEVGTTNLVSNGSEKKSVWSLLLVTQDRALQASLAPILDGLGYRLDVADSQSQAQELIGLRRPEIILLDFDAAGVSPAQLIGQLRERMETAMIQVILLTSQGPGGLQGLDCGADEFLLKPLDLKRLAVRLEQALERVPRAASNLRNG